MANENKPREIEQMERAGLNVIVVGAEGKLDYATNNQCNSEYCDNCSAFRLLSDPCPYDWFRSGDMKAVCLKVNGVIAGGLERPSKMTNIEKPLYCPNLGRELSEEEKQEAEKDLAGAIKRMN